jgi:invasion protein IalB
MIFAAYSSRWRIAALGLAIAALASALASAEAATKKTQKEAAKKTEEAAKPNLVATFGDWNVFVSQTPRGRICYVLAQPKTREPDGLKRDPGYAFISDRPSEGVRNEVSFIMGFDVAGGTESESKSEAGSSAKTRREARSERRGKTKSLAGPLASVGEESFDLLPKGSDLWVKNAAREGALIAEMKKGATLEIKAASLRGNESTDAYSLTGFSQAMERLQKECPAKS